MKILIIQNRIGIGDMIIFLPFVEAISKKFGVPVSCLLKKNTKADQILKNNKFIKEIIFLERDKQKGKDDGFKGSIDLIFSLRNYKFDKVFIFNSSLRFNLISKLSGIKKIYQYPLFKKNKQHIIITAQRFLNKELGINVESKPIINIDNKTISHTKEKYNIDHNFKNILLGIGGSGPTKRIPPNIIIKFMELICDTNAAKFFLATGKDIDEQIILKEIMNSKFKEKCIPLDNLNIVDILPIIKNCDISICNDSSFSHLSAALEIPTIVMMADTPLVYGDYSPNMHPIIPDGYKTVSHNTLGKNKINPEKVFKKFIELLN